MSIQLAVLVANCVLQGILAAAFSFYLWRVRSQTKMRFRFKSKLKGALVFVTFYMKFVIGLYDCLKYDNEQVLQWWRAGLVFLESLTFMAVYLSLIFRFIGL